MINDTLECVRISHMSWWVYSSGSGGVLWSWSTLKTIDLGSVVIISGILDDPEMNQIWRTTTLKTGKFGLFLIYAVMGWSWYQVTVMSDRFSGSRISGLATKSSRTKKMRLNYASRPSGWWRASIKDLNLSRKQVSQRLIGTMSTYRPR